MKKGKGRTLGEWQKLTLAELQEITPEQWATLSEKEAALPEEEWTAIPPELWKILQPVPDGDKRVSEKYHRNPTLENYVKLRRDFPSDEIHCMEHVSSIWTFENLEAEGLDPALYYECLKGDAEAISEMSLVLMEKIVAKKEAAKEKANDRIDLKLINFLVWGLLAVIHNGSIFIPPKLRPNSGIISHDLNRLARYLIDSDNSALQKKSKARDQRVADLHYGVALKWDGITPSGNKLSEHLGVVRSTVNKYYFPRGSYQSEVNKYIEWTDEFEALVRECIHLKTDEEIQDWQMKEPRSDTKDSMAIMQLEKRRLNKKLEQIVMRNRSD